MDALRGKALEAILVKSHARSASDASNRSNKAGSTSYNDSEPPPPLGACYGGGSGGGGGGGDGGGSGVKSRGGGSLLSKLAKGLSCSTGGVDDIDGDSSHGRPTQMFSHRRLTGKYTVDKVREGLNIGGWLVQDVNGMRRSHARCAARHGHDTDTTRHDTTRHDATRRDATRHDTTRHDATRRNATRRDATRRDATRRECPNSLTTTTHACTYTYTRTRTTHPTPLHRRQPRTTSH